MNMTEIRRERVSVPATDTETATLAIEAREILGYGVLEERVTAVSEKHDGTELSSALAGLQIEPLNADDVMRYKTERMKERAKELFDVWLSDSAQTSAFFGPTWDTLAIDKYKSPIPEFVLNKAIQIKKACPGAIIEVEFISDRPDPFLVASIKKPTHYSWGDYQETVEKFYVEVWAEPKFEGRL